MHSDFARMRDDLVVRVDVGRAKVDQNIDDERHVDCRHAMKITSSQAHAVV